MPLQIMRDDALIQTYREPDKQTHAHTLRDIQMQSNKAWRELLQCILVSETSC